MIHGSYDIKPSLYVHFSPLNLLHNVTMYIPNTDFNIVESSTLTSPKRTLGISESILNTFFKFSVYDKWLPSHVLPIFNFIVIIIYGKVYQTWRFYHASFSILCYITFPRPTHTNLCERHNILYTAVRAIWSFRAKIPKFHLKLRLLQIKLARIVSHTALLSRHTKI